MIETIDVDLEQVEEALAAVAVGLDTHVDNRTHWTLGAIAERARAARDLEIEMQDEQDRMEAYESLTFAEGEPLMRDVDLAEEPERAAVYLQGLDEVIAGQAPPSLIHELFRWEATVVPGRGDPLTYWAAIARSGQLTSVTVGRLMRVRDEIARRAGLEARYAPRVAPDEPALSEEMRGDLQQLLAVHHVVAQALGDLTQALPEGLLSMSSHAAIVASLSMAAAVAAEVLVKYSLHSADADPSEIPTPEQIAEMRAQAERFTKLAEMCLAMDTLRRTPPAGSA